MPKPNRKSRPDRDAPRRLLLQKQAFELKRQGHTFTEIGERLKVDPTTARNYVNAETALNYPPEAAAQEIAADIAALNEIVRVNYPGMLNGDQTATDNVIKAVRAKHQITGHSGDRYTQINIGSGKPVDFDIEGAIRRLNFVKSPHENDDIGPIPGASERYSASVHKFTPKLLEAPAIDPEPVEAPQPAPTARPRAAQGKTYAKFGPNAWSGEIPEGEPRNEIDLQPPDETKRQKPFPKKVIDGQFGGNPPNASGGFYHAGKWSAYPERKK